MSVTQPNRVLWGEGMFLLPHHFQQGDRFWEWRLGEALRATQAHPWGVRSVAWDPEALERGLLRVDQLEAVFPDGTFLAAPKASPLPPARQLGDIAGLGSENIIYATLPLWNPFGGNVDSNGAKDRTPRFLAEPVQTTDLFTNAVEGEVLTLLPNVALLVGGENRDGCLSLPVGRLLRTPSGAWAIDEEFIPPLAEVRGSAHMLRLVRRLVEIIQVKSQALSGGHRERIKSVVDFGTSDVASFWLLHSINRCFPAINHILRFPQIHPEFLFLTLAEMASELLTFSSTRTLAEVPSYDHDNLTLTFRQLDELIRALLDTVISTRFLLIPLTSPKPSMRVGHLDSDRLQEGAEFFLSVSGEQNAAFFLEELPLKLKVGSPDDVEKILHSALPGVRLRPTNQPPTALPVRVGNHYLALEPAGQIFERMLRSRSVCIYTPQTLPDFKMELYAVFQ